MVRRYRRRIVNKDKYSIEQTVIRTHPLNSWTTIASIPPNIAESRQFKIPVLPASDMQGMRKVKHLTFTISNGEWPNSEADSLLYALVYVPQGYHPQDINFPALDSAVSLYDANQYVMSSGVLDFGGGPLRIRSPLSRNLNSGDSIYLLLALPYYPKEKDSIFTIEVKYAITLQ